VILLIDNYDSFTYNLFQLLSEQGAEVEVRRNDELQLADVRELEPGGIVISPGPGRPESAGISLELLAQLGDRTPILGVCLGHQCLGAAFGAKIVPAPVLMHGKTSFVHHNRSGVFLGIQSPFEAVRYHSLVVDRRTVPECLEVTAETEDGVVMGLRHREFPLEGVQFHPESVLTRSGPNLINNFLVSCREFQ
jgi:anthranilate synthase component II